MIGSSHQQDEVRGYNHVRSRFICQVGIITVIGLDDKMVVLTESKLRFASSMKSHQELSSTLHQ
jgi:Holliday junction resolvase-like predicted endonuclease